MTCNNSRYKLFAPLAIVAATLVGCNVDDSAPTHPRTGNLLIPNEKAEENAEKRALEKPTPDLPTTGGETPGSSNTRRFPERTVVTLHAGHEETPATDSNNPMNAILRELGFVGPPDWQAFGHTKTPIDVYDKNPYIQTIPHLPANPGTEPMPGSIPAPSGEWSIENSWGQGLTLKDYPHRPWPEVGVTYGSGAVKGNPTYYYNVQDQLHVKKYIADFTHDVEKENYQSHWFYMNAVAMPVWVVLEPPVPQHGPPAVQAVRNDWKSDAYGVPWFFITTLFLPGFMLLEPPLNQRITANESADPNFRGSIPSEGPVVPAPMPGRLDWFYPSFQNPDGTLRRPGGTAADPATAPAP